jgi:hypothetical protein
MSILQPMKIVASLITSSTRAHLIGEALRSLSWADLIQVNHFVVPAPVIADNTLEIAKSVAGPKLQIVHIPYDSASISPMRNQALENANATGCDWLAMIDTDERIHTNGMDVRALLRRLPADVTLASVRSTDGVFTKPIFFRLPTTHRFRNVVHEQLDAPASELPVLRYTEVPKDPAALAARCRIDESHLAQQAMDEPDNPRWPYMRGCALEYLGRFYEAAGCFRAAAALHKQGPEFSWCCYRSADALLQIGDVAGAVTITTSAQDRGPFIAEMACVLSEATFVSGDSKAAIKYATGAILRGYQTREGRARLFGGAVNPACLFDMPYILMAQAYAALGNKKAERDAARKADAAEAARIRWAQTGSF